MYYFHDKLSSNCSTEGNAWAIMYAETSAAAAGSANSFSQRLSFSNSFWFGSLPYTASNAGNIAADLKLYRSLFATKGEKLRQKDTRLMNEFKDLMMESGQEAIDDQIEAYADALGTVGTFEDADAAAVQGSAENAVKQWNGAVWADSVYAPEIFHLWSDLNDCGSGFYAR